MEKDLIPVFEPVQQGSNPRGIPAMAIGKIPRFSKEFNQVSIVCSIPGDRKAERQVAEYCARCVEIVPKLIELINARNGKTEDWTKQMVYEDLLMLLHGADQLEPSISLLSEDTTCET